MADSESLRWARWIGRALPDAYRTEILDDLLDERRRLRRAGRSRLWCSLWLIWHLALSAVAARRRPEAPRSTDGRRRERLVFGSPFTELKHALRALRRSPWYAATIVATVALSVSLAATVFAVVDGVLFRALPYPDSDDIYVLSGAIKEEPGPGDRGVRLMSVVEVNSWNDRVPGLAATGLIYSSVRLPDASFARIVHVDQHFDDVFRPPILIGGLRPDHFDPGRSAHAVVISYRLWQDQFGADSAVVGRTFQSFSGNETLEIVGVMAPDGFVPPLPSAGAASTRTENRIDAFVVRPIQAASERSLIAFARIPNGTLPETRDALSRAAADFQAAATPPNPNLPERVRRLRAAYDDIDVLPLERFLTWRTRPVLLMVFVASISLVALVLLNCGALTTARFQQRMGDLALRRALGARSRDLFRHALAEQGLLMVTGAVAGVVAAPTLLAAVVSRLPPGLVLIKDPQVDWRVIVFAGVLALMATVLVAALGVRLALKHAHLSPAATDSRGHTSRGLVLSRVLIAGQVALAFSLILGGAFFIASIASVLAEDSGLREHSAAMFTISTPERVPRTRMADVVAEIRRTPGVVAVGSFSGSLLSNYKPQSDFRVPAGIQTNLETGSLMVGSEFFEAAGVRLLQGRFPTDAELDSGAPVIVISDTVARDYWPTVPALGQMIQWNRTDCMVVGVVDDVRVMALDFEPPGMIYGSWMLMPGDTFGVRLFAAFESDAPATLASVVATLSQTHPEFRVTDATTLADAMADSIRPRRLSALIASIFALCALAFVAVGLLGVVAMTASRRTREMGIRLALGATPGGVVRLLVGEQLQTVLAGLMAGAAISLPATRLIEAHLYKLTTHDAGVWAAATMVIALTGIVGAYLPAARAGQIEVMRALTRE